MKYTATYTCKCGNTFDIVMELGMAYANAYVDTMQPAQCPNCGHAPEFTVHVRLSEL